MCDMVNVRRTNTILYTDRWANTVAFYRTALALPVTFENEWFIEFAVGDSSFVSVADAARTSVAAGSGAGLTLSWQVDDVADVRATLCERGIEVSSIGKRWGARVVDVFDPSGNRIEFWSEPGPPDGSSVVANGRRAVTRSGTP